VIARLLPICFPADQADFVKLTDSAVSNLRLSPGKSEIIVFDEALPGFGIRLRSGGKRSWIVQYRSGRQQRRLSLGTVETIDAASARKRAKAALAQAQLGRDPQAEKAAARAPKIPELVLEDLVEKYLLVAKRRLKASTYAGIVLHLRKHWKSLHSQEVRNLERRHISAEIGRIAETSGLYGANRSRAALSALFAWAIGEGLANANPVVGTNKAIDEVPRDRVLSPDELRLVWQHAGPSDYGAIVRLLILTGQRREEVGGMLWSEIDLDGALWSMDASRTKNTLPHDVPLAPSAVAILRGLRRREGRDLVFGSSEGSFQGWSNAKASLDQRMSAALVEETSDKKVNIKPWRLHDIRRTVATRLGDLGVQPHVVEAVLNHISGSKAGVAGIYNKAAYAVEKRAALEKWGAHVATLLAKSEVTAIAPSANKSGR
jgi:integrase